MRHSVLATVVSTLALLTGSGWTTAGWVDSKSYSAPHSEVHCVGNKCHRDDVPECWRLHVHRWFFYGSSCAPDRPTWEQVQIGQWWQPL